MTGDSKKIKFTVDKKDGEEDKDALCDVAPTVLDIPGLSQPKDMTGCSLFAKSS
ncbi:hypothetical protein EWM64_g4022 [Hericium alpestre]|uniref:Uncharacterized protein n=1 Tax=Hericium alpestre TaxID=135208 RepID=A0A4Z0A291_9AGAM|nr:hypothetical protein EWM64_g4022 [Hericium alpestre]